MNQFLSLKSLPIAKLDDVAESIVDGPFGSNLKTSDYVESGVPVLQGKNITGNEFVWKEIRFITDQKAETLKRSSTIPGDHLIIKIGSIGYSAILDDLKGHGFAIIPANLARIRPDRSKIDDRFLHRILTSDFISRHFQKVASKTAQPALSLKKIKETEIPLPPLEEQRRIAKILDVADALRAKRREALAQLDTLLQATFLDMFGDPVTNPKGWEVKQLDEICQKITDGTHHSPPIQDSGIPYITAKHLKPDGIKFFENPWFISEKDHIEIYRRCNPKKDDVLYIKDGATTGIAAINRYDFPFSMLSSLALLRTNKKICTPEYLCSWLNDNQNKTNLLGNMGGAAIKRLTLAKIKSFKVPLPPITIQLKYTKIVLSIEQQKARMRAHLAELDGLFGALQQRAFRGEL